MIMSLDLVKLRGITWNHSRGFIPMVATAQRFGELNPEVEIIWSKRSLQDFADKPLGELANNFDLLVIDHPWAGFVSNNEILLPLDNFLPSEYLEDQAKNSVGASFESYTYNGHQWALGIDAATPVASSRPDLLAGLNFRLPETFDDVLALASEGCVIFPAIPIDTLMNFYMFCIAFGETPFLSDKEVVSQEVGIQSLQAMRKLAEKVDPICFEMNPIKVYEALSNGDRFAYCPFAYGYVNYSRKGYSKFPLQFHELVSMGATGKLRSTLGGTGLAISKTCKHPDVALEYLKYVASPDCQQTLYFDNGGQPAHRSAWEANHPNNLTHNFFKETLPVHDRAFLRPRYDGYMHFQDNAGSPIRDYMMRGGNEENVLKSLNLLYKGVADPIKDPA